MVGLNWWLLSDRPKISAFFFLLAEWLNETFCITRLEMFLTIVENCFHLVHNDHLIRALNTPCPIVVGRIIKNTVVLQGWRDVTQDKGRDGCCVVTASDCCMSVLYFHSHLQRNSRSDQAMLKSWCASRHIMFWFVYWRSGDLTSR